MNQIYPQVYVVVEDDFKYGVSVENVYASLSDAWKELEFIARNLADHYSIDPDDIQWNSNNSFYIEDVASGYIAPRMLRKGYDPDE